MPLETYLKYMYDNRGTGSSVAGASFYPTLSTLLSEIGGRLKPKVRCFQHLKNTGAGIPDFGLYTSDQFQRGSETPIEFKPSCGVIEFKGLDDNVGIIADSEQVARYSAVSTAGDSAATVGKVRG